MSTEELRLPAKTTIETAQEIVATASGIDSERTFVIDASEVETIDGAAVLAIATVAHTFKERGEVVAVNKPTPAFVDAFADLGLFEDMMKLEFRK